LINFTYHRIDLIGGLDEGLKKQVREYLITRNVDPNDLKTTLTTNPGIARELLVPSTEGNTSFSDNHDGNINSKRPFSSTPTHAQENHINMRPTRPKTAKPTTSSNFSATSHMDNDSLASRKHSDDQIMHNHTNMISQSNNYPLKSALKDSSVTSIASPTRSVAIYDAKGNEFEFTTTLSNESSIADMDLRYRNTFPNQRFDNREGSELLGLEYVDTNPDVILLQSEIKKLHTEIEELKSEKRKNDKVFFY
jgi:hypothetical protein